MLIPTEHVREDRHGGGFGVSKFNLMRKIFYFLMILILFFACVAQKDRRSVNRVKANVTLLNQVGVEWLKLHPCANDTIIKSIPIPGKTDTITKVDTLINNIPGKPITVYVTKYINRTDTIVKVVMDNQQINILKDTVQANYKAISFLQGMQLVKDAQIRQAKKWNWIFGGIIGLLFVIGVINLYLKLKPKI
jgi:hypothetical protein